MNKCCVKWLKDGHLEEDDGYGGYDEYSFRNRCDGSCGRDHPKITLSFDVERKVVLVTLSHQLDPFCKIFLQRCVEDTAWPQSTMSYELDGFLRENRTQIRQALKQYHLIEVASGALAASDLVQSEQMEEETRAANRARIEQHQAILDESGTLEEVLSNELGGYLDFISLYCMSRVSHKFHKGAKRIVSERLRTAKFSIIPRIDGMKQNGPDKLDGYEPRYRKQEQVDLEFDDEQNARMDVFVTTIEIQHIFAGIAAFCRLARATITVTMITVIIAGRSTKRTMWVRFSSCIGIRIQGEFLCTNSSYHHWGYF
jgi:hypothetical protein